MSSNSLRVLIVDDQPAVVRALGLLFELNDILFVTASSPREALAVASSERLGAILQDMNFDRNETSGDEGTQLFRSLREAQPGVPMLLMTAWASLETAVELVREGATDYIQKPWDDDKLVATVRNLVKLRSLELENESLRQELALSRSALAKEHDLCGLIYASDSMHRVVSLAVSIASSDAPVLITGPSGSGKERLAEIVQANSRRSRNKGPFIRVNVGAIPEELIESELFGAESGAYTGAGKRRIGHFESADRGTLLLDEIDSLSPAGQVKLLRVLQSGEFQRLGSSRTQRVDVRIISATNASLQDRLQTGGFREDLFFRLNVVELRLPPLSERTDDILPLATYFLEQHSGGRPRLLLDDAAAALVRHPWPGNVRELENRIQRACLVATGESIGLLDLGDLGFQNSSVEEEKHRRRSGSEEEERQRLVKILAEESGVVSRAADRMEVSRQALYRKMDRLGIELERRPKA